MTERTTEVLRWRAIHGPSSSTPWSAVPFRSGPIGGRTNGRGGRDARPLARDLDSAPEAHESDALKVPSGTSQALTLRRGVGVEPGKEVNPL